MPLKPPTHRPPGRRSEAERQAALDRRRGSRQARGYDDSWAAASRAFLQRHPLCVRCREAGRREPATVTDHIRPHRGDRQLFWDPANWQPLCASCHGRKTALEDGGFGLPVRG